MQVSARAILATYPTLIDVKKRKSSADPFLIAAAIVHKAAVVTEERPSGGPGKVKIPDVCREMKIPCMTLLEMMLREGAMSS